MIFSIAFYLSIFQFCFYAYANRPTGTFPIRAGDKAAGLILNVHNIVRKSFSIKNLTYDDGLANNAYKQFANRTLADPCNLTHSGASGVGENLGSYSDTSINTTLEKYVFGAIAGWPSEIDLFENDGILQRLKEGTTSSNEKLKQVADRLDYYFMNCFDDVGHVNQVLWNGTRKVGCAATFSTCPSGDINFHTILVSCHYYPAGNVIGTSFTGRNNNHANQGNSAICAKLEGKKKKKKKKDQPHYLAQVFEFKRFQTDQQPESNTYNVPQLPSNERPPAELNLRVNTSERDGGNRSKRSISNTGGGEAQRSNEERINESSRYPPQTQADSRVYCKPPNRPYLSKV